jgi:hypothetical protein
MGAVLILIREDFVGTRWSAAVSRDGRMAHHTSLGQRGSLDYPVWMTEMARLLVSESFILKHKYGYRYRYKRLCQQRITHIPIHELSFSSSWHTMFFCIIIAGTRKFGVAARRTLGGNPLVKVIIWCVLAIRLFYMSRLKIEWYLKLI